MKKILLSMALVLVSANISLAAEATGVVEKKETAAGNIALGAHISTLGIGPEISLGLSDYFSSKVSVNWGAYDVEGETDDVDYDCELELMSGLITAEWFPWAGNFHIDAGLLANGNNFSGKGEPSASGTFTFDGVTYTAAEAGTVKVDIDFDDIAPYVGLGWGNTVAKNSNITFFVNLGVVFQGEPDVSIKTSGTLANNAQFLARVEAEKRELEDDLDSFDIYPVIALGLSYKF